MRGQHHKFGLAVALALVVGLAALAGTESKALGESLARASARLPVTPAVGGRTTSFKTRFKSLGVDAGPGYGLTIRGPRPCNDLTNGQDFGTFDGPTTVVFGPRERDSGDFEDERNITVRPLRNGRGITRWCVGTYRASIHNPDGDGSDGGSFSFRVRR